MYVYLSYSFNSKQCGDQLHCLTKGSVSNFRHLDGKKLSEGTYIATVEDIVEVKLHL